MNSKLYDTSIGEVVIPKEVKQHLTNSIAQAKGADQNTEGFRRNQELQLLIKLLQQQTQALRKRKRRLKPKPWFKHSKLLLKRQKKSPRKQNHLRRQSQLKRPKVAKKLKNEIMIINSFI